MITNNDGIPEIIVRAIEGNLYKGSKLERFASATSILKPNKIFVLEKRHGFEISEEASSMIWSLMGSAMHTVLEKALINIKNFFKNRKVICEASLLTRIDGEIITGHPDLYENGVISDYKFTSVWSYIYKSGWKEYEAQLNIYALMFREEGFKISQVQNIFIFRDWSATKAKFEHSYPKKQIEVKIHPLWMTESTIDFLTKRINSLKSSLELSDDDIPSCTQEERWQNDTKFAVKKKGLKKASKLCKTADEACSFILSQSGRKEDYTVEKRIGVPRRCIDYCSVNKFCNFYKNYIEENNG